MRVSNTLEESKKFVPWASGGRSDDSHVQSLMWDKRVSPVFLVLVLGPGAGSGVAVSRAARKLHEGQTITSNAHLDFWTTAVENGVRVLWNLESLGDKIAGTAIIIVPLFIDQPKLRLISNSLAQLIS